jgi:hypothetical protein
MRCNHLARARESTITGYVPGIAIATAIHVTSPGIKHLLFSSFPTRGHDEPHSNDIPLKAFVSIKNEIFPFRQNN